MTGARAIAVIVLALSGLVTQAGAQERPVGSLTSPAPDIRCERLGVDVECARRRLDFWGTVLGQTQVFTPEYDRGAGDALLTADSDARHSYVFDLSLGNTDAADGAWATLAFMFFTKAGWFPVHWEGHIPAAEGQRLMAELDMALAALPPPTGDLTGCLHSQAGAIERARGRNLATYAIDFCEADGKAMWPVYRAFITAAQAHALGCDPESGWMAGELGDLTNCLRLEGDRASAKGAHDAVVKRIERWEARIGEIEARAHVWDLQTFGAGDRAVVTGFWLRTNGDSYRTFPEAERNRFIEVWVRTDGLWHRQSVEGVPLPE